MLVYSLFILVEKIVFRSPFSVFRFPFSVLRLPYQVFHGKYSGLSEEEARGG